MTDNKNKQQPFSKYLGYFRSKLFHKGLFTGVVATAAYSFVFASKLLEKREKSLKETFKEELLTSGYEYFLLDKSAADSAKFERSREILKYGMPDRGPQVRCYTNHVLVYDQQKRTPVWVAEHITADMLKGEVSRKNIRFQPDPGVPTEFSAANSDYLGSGWSRGHMNPAGDNKHAQNAMVDSFYLSNILPQNLANNAGFWNRLEIYCRDLVKKYPNVYVISGPLVLPETREDGTKIVTYQVIGENEVSVPTHLFKVILVEDNWDKPSAVAAFVVPNQPIGYEHHLKEYQVTLPQLHKMTGMKFNPVLKQSTLKDLCEVDGCKLMPRDEFELYFIGRKLESSTTLNRLEKVWGEIEEKKLKPDEYLTNLYNRKRLDIQATKKTES